MFSAIESPILCGLRKKDHSQHNRYILAERFHSCHHTRDQLYESVDGRGAEAGIKCAEDIIRSLEDEDGDQVGVLRYWRKNWAQALFRLQMVKGPGSLEPSRARAICWGHPPGGGRVARRRGTRGRQTSRTKSSRRRALCCISLGNNAGSSDDTY